MPAKELSSDYCLMFFFVTSLIGNNRKQNGSHKVLKLVKFYSLFCQNTMFLLGKQMLIVIQKRFFQKFVVSGHYGSRAVERRAKRYRVPRPGLF